MPFDKPLESNRFQVSPIGLLLGLGFVLYVYRFPIGIGNISMLRIAMFVLGSCLLLAVAQSKRVLSATHLALIVGIVFLSAINIYYYPFLNEY